MVTPVLPSIAVLSSPAFVLSFQVELPNLGGIACGGELTFDDVQVRVDAQGGVLLRGARAKMSSVTATGPHFSLRIPSIELEDVTATLAGGAIVEMRAEQAVASSLRIDAGGVAIEIATARADGGLRRAEDGGLRFGSASLEGIRVVLREPRRQGASTLSGSLMATFGNLIGEVLDRLEGHVGFQVVIGIDLPVLGRRKTTSNFQLPVISGTVEYALLERGLASIIDTAFDLELRDDTLILEKDLPLLPFDNVTTLVWKLNPTEVQVAKAGRVRFATLLRAEQPPGLPNDDLAKLLDFVSIDEIAIDLSVATAPVVLEWPGGGQIVWGSTLVPPLDTFTVRGNVMCKGDAEAVAAPTTIRAGLARAAILAEGVPLGGLETVVAGAELYELEVEATMLGFVPREVSIRAGQLKLAPRV